MKQFLPITKAEMLSRGIETPDLFMSQATHMSITPALACRSSPVCWSITVILW